MPPHGSAIAPLRLGMLAAGTALLLSGCAGGGVSPLGDSLRAAMPGLSGEAPAAQRAASLPYASLVLSTEDRSGLVVLGAEAGGTTLWPTGNDGSLALYQEGLAATAGLGQDLLSLRYQPLEAEPGSDSASLVPWRQATPLRYRVESHWQLPGGDMVTARGRAELTCGSATQRLLPMGERALEACREVVQWGNGTQSVSHYYRSPDDRRLWAAKVMPWPSGPALEWEVARAWW
ncbi:MAG: YjbF family lipoprotein [Halomonas sp.]|uniref:YjbF family lipoprotein n=1 Tax=Halomonas sp. TaxID=1486246 RepID=UPI00286FD0A2|nr:YjbF family lipoprotein [Halomonas sp.]MDR9439319.1 YjbF family lipoprotein [Halomonas sp.]